MSIWEAILGGAGALAPNKAGLLQSLGAVGGGAALPASGLSGLGRSLSAFGGGLAQASGPSRMPVSFGQALAGGNRALEAQQDSDLNRQLLQAKVGYYGNKGKDFDSSAQQALIKLNAGQELSPEEQATLKAWDTIQTSKISSVPLPNGTYGSAPARRSVLPPGFGGAAQPQPQAQPQTQSLPDPRRARYEELMRKSQGM